MKLRKLVEVRNGLHDLYFSAAAAGDAELADALSAAWELAADKVEVELSARRSATSKEGTA